MDKRERRAIAQLSPPATTAVPHMHKAIHPYMEPCLATIYSLKTKGTPTIKQGCFTDNSWPPCSTHHGLVSSLLEDACLCVYFLLLDLSLACNLC
jgi:hypothetical protein